MQEQEAEVTAHEERSEESIGAASSLLGLIQLNITVLDRYLLVDGFVGKSGNGVRLGCQMLHDGGLQLGDGVEGASDAFDGCQVGLKSLGQCRGLRGEELNLFLGEICVTKAGDAACCTWRRVCLFALGLPTRHHFSLRRPHPRLLHFAYPLSSTLERRADTSDDCIAVITQLAGMLNDGYVSLNSDSYS